MRKCLVNREATRGQDMEFVWKTLANSSYGKLIQHIDVISIKKLARLCLKEGCTIQDWYSMSIMERNLMQEVNKYSVTEINVGAMFCPEWACLGTGRARSWLARGLLLAQNPTYTSTDSIWCNRGTELGDDWDIKESGISIVARTRLGSIGNHLASHSIWRKDEAQKLLDDFANGRYDARTYFVDRGRKVKECLRKGLPIGAWINNEKHTGDTAWDGKRVLLSDGNTRPLQEAI
jgi:hypothetical protein